MTSDAPDDITDGLLSDSTYRRLRIERFAHFKQSVPTKLKWQCGLLVALVLTLPIYEVFPATVEQYLPASDPSVASPKVIVVGAVGGAITVASMAMLTASTLYRLRHEPLTEYQAHGVLNVEDFASLIGLIAGTMAIGIMVAYVLLAAVGGGSAIAQYIAMMDGVNPFADSGIGITVVDVALSAFGAAVAGVWVSEYLRFRIVTESIEQRANSD